MFSLKSFFIALACTYNFGKGEFQADVSLEVLQGAVVVEAQDAGISHYFGPSVWNPYRSELSGSGFMQASDDTLRVYINEDANFYKLFWLSRYNVDGIDECRCFKKELDGSD